MSLYHSSQTFDNLLGHGAQEDFHDRSQIFLKYLPILFWHKNMAFWKPWCFCLIPSLPFKLHLCTRRSFTPFWGGEYRLLLCGPVCLKTHYPPASASMVCITTPDFCFVLSSQILCYSKLIALICSMQVFNRKSLLFQGRVLKYSIMVLHSCGRSDFLLLNYIVSRVTMLCLPYSSLLLLTLCSFSWLLLIAQVFLFPSFIFRYYILLFVFISPN